MRTYIADRRRFGTTVLAVEEFEGRRHEKPLKHFARHSPAGFEWGYPGSGPADLALALCADAMGAIEPAFAVYQDFKWQVVALLPFSGWTIEQQAVLDVIARIREEAAEKVGV